MIRQHSTVRCDRCDAELLPIRGQTFASTDDARDAMDSSGWEESGESVYCYGCAGEEEDES